MNSLESYESVYGHLPKSDFESQRHYNEFCKLLKDYSLETIRELVKSPVSLKSQQTGLNRHHYLVNALTEQILISHIKLIHSKWGISIPDVQWWDRAIKSQAKDMFAQYSKEELHYWLHRLENDQWYREHITDPFTFKMIEKYIAKNGDE